MSKIHAPAIPRITDPVNGEGMLSLFDALVDEAEELGVEVSQVAMPYIEDGDKFVPGTWVPELWLVARKVLPDEDGE
jgi:hypothetical protein